MNRYEIVEKIGEKIGEGGMQVVYRAIDQVFGRDVVLKIPKNESAEKRFQTSASSIKITDFGIAKMAKAKLTVNVGSEDSLRSPPSHRRERQCVGSTVAVRRPPHYVHAHKNIPPDTSMR